MGRKLNLSTPTVINTELVPLDESFYIEANGQTEQWFYDNTAQYAPDRSVTPLLLTPVLSAFDQDTQTSYTPTFYTTQWFANEYNATTGDYVETAITNTTDSSSASYVISGNNLLVKKNVSYTRSVTIRCLATYIDPRDSGITYTVQDTVILSCNRDANVVFPEVAITNPSGRTFNPLTDYKTVGGQEVQDSEFDFDGVITNSPDIPTTGSDVAKYHADGWGTEEMVSPANGCAPIVSIRYPDGTTEEDSEFMYRQTAGGDNLAINGNAYITNLKGNTVAWNQLVRNGDFSNGTTGWQAVNTNISVSSNIITATIGTGSGDGKIQRVDFRNITGHKYYIRGDYWKDYHPANVPVFSIGGHFSASGENVENEWVTEKRIVTTDSSYTGNSFIIYTRMTTSINGTFKAKNVFTIDLTLIYGEGNEPTTVEAFEADYERRFGKPLTYEDYDAGSLRPVLTTAIKTTGFNQYNNGTAKVISGENYQISGTYTGVTLDGETITPDASGLFTTSGGSSLVVAGGGSNTCVHLVGDGSRNGQYEAYNGQTAQLNIPAITGKLNGTGDSVVVFPDGMKKTGSVYDEIRVENGVVKAIKRIGSVDMGTLTWRYDGSFYTNNPGLPITGDNTTIASLLCAQYVTCKYYTGGVYFEGRDKAIAFGYMSGRRLFVKDSAYTDASLFTTAKNGEMLYYELATPLEYVLDPIQAQFIFEWFGISNGTEVLVDTLPWYKSGQNTSKLTVDAMYGEDINVVLRAKDANGVMSPSKAYASIQWRIPDVDTHVESHNGSAVRSNTETMEFSTIMNIKGGVLSEERKQAHLRLNWKHRKNTQTTEVDDGWGLSKIIPASDLRNVRGATSSLASTLVYPYVYVMGAYEKVTDNNATITDNGEVVYDRPIE